MQLSKNVKSKFSIHNAFNISNDLYIISRSQCKNNKKLHLNQTSMSDTFKSNCH